MTDISDSDQEPLRIWMPAFALAIGLLLALWPTFSSGFALIPGGLQDTRLVHFSLEHAHRYLSGQELNADLWDPPLYFPARNVAAYTDTMISMTSLYSPWRWMGLAPDTAFQVWIVLVLGLNFVAFFLVLRALGTGWIGASAGAYLFAFGSVRLANLGHSQLIPGFMLAFACLAVVRFFALNRATQEARRASWIWIAVFFLMLVIQAYGAFYPLYFFVLCAGFMILVALALPEARALFLTRLRDEWFALLVGGGLALLAVAPLLERYLLTAEMLGTRPWVAFEAMLPRWSSWLLMGKSNWFYGWVQETPFILSQGSSMRTGTHSNGLGVVTLLAIAVGLYTARRRLVVRLMMPTVLIVILVTTVLPGGQTLWRFFYEFVPGANAVRALGRIGMLFLIPGAVGLAFFCDRLIQQRRFVGLVVVALLVVLEHGHSHKTYNKYTVRDHVAKVVSAVETMKSEQECQTFFASTIGDHRYPAIHEDAEWAAFELGLPTINGRYGNAPLAWDLRRVHRRLGQRGVVTHQRTSTALARWIRENGLRPERVCWLEFDAEFESYPQSVGMEPGCPK